MQAKNNKDDKQNKATNQKGSNKASQNNKLSNNAQKKPNKLLIGGIIALVAIIACISIYNYKHQKDVELGKLDYETHDVKPKKPKKPNENQNEQTDDQSEEIDQNTGLKANEADLRAANQADFGEYPFNLFKKENAKLLNDDSAAKYKDEFVKHFTNFTNEIKKARDTGDTGMTKGMLEELEMYFQSEDTMPYQRIVEDVYNHGKQVYVTKNDIYLFQNDDPSYQTNRPAIVAVRCKCNNDQVVYYLQGLAIMSEGHQGFIPFKTILR